MPKRPEHWKEPPGRIEMVVGSMYGGKSSEVIRRVDVLRRAGADVMVFKHPFDDRYEGVGKISSHDGRSVECMAVADPVDIYDKVTESDPLVVVIDEVQFYIDSAEVLIEVVRAFADEGRLVILAGLNMDFRGEPFGPMPILMAIADQIQNLSAVCTVCGGEAHFTQRVVGLQPADYESAIVEVGAEEKYEARCRRCHEVPGRPKFDRTKY